MTNVNQGYGLQLHSLVTEGGELQLSLAKVPIPTPGPEEILVRVEGAPINPSDLRLLLGPADLSTLNVTGSGEDMVVSAKIPPQFVRAVSGRVGIPLPVGSEGAGVVIDASDDTKSLIGKTVAVLGGAMYSQYRIAKATEALVVHGDATPKDAASSFVNPLTALGMVGTMRMEGHTALVHTAAASNLGQMLVKVCLKDGVELVNIVRKPDQVVLLKGLGAKHVVDSSAASFMDDLIAALTETGASVAFDAVGGGKLADQILTAMEVAAVKRGGVVFGPYGSNTFKQIYMYGGLDSRPAELNRAYGMRWAIGGWLLTFFMEEVGPVEIGKLRQRVADELKTTFVSHYTAEISLLEALQPDMIAAYDRKITGEKYLINPNKKL